MVFCEVYSLELTLDRCTRLKLKGNAAGINDAYSELFDSLMKKYADHQFSSFHNYLSDKPVFMCNSCFSVTITRVVSGDTHTIIEDSLFWSKIVGRRAKQYDFPKPAGSATNTPHLLTNSSIVFCCWCFKLS